MTAPEGLASLCQNSTFATPEVPGVAITLIIAETVHKFSGEAPWYYNFNKPGASVSDAAFYYVTVSYTHSGQDDPTNVRAYMPVSSPAWNRRFQAVGGGG
ncbi:hypothetical protein AB5N19_11029 [Seiridium cardinale]